MIFKRIQLDEADARVTLDCYIADPMQCFTRSAILVLPGGGYGHLCPREAEPVGMAFMPYGYNAFVLNYSVNRVKRHPAQLIQASLAMKYIRDHAAEFGHDPNKVFAVGFSAGAHLCAMLGIRWNLPEVTSAIGDASGINRPTGIMLCYPVVTGVEEYRNFGTFKNLFCSDDPAREDLESASPERFVSKETSAPAFFMHTSNDEGVDVRNSFLLASAYREAGIEFEMHIYPDAPHGIALGNKITARDEPRYVYPRLTRWVEDAAAWAKELTEGNL